MMKKRVIYYDHSFHEKTKSTGFFIDLLKEKYEVITIFDKSWIDNNPPPEIDDINKLNPDIIVFFQNIPHLKQLGKIRCDNKIWIPMWDGCSHTKATEWCRYLSHKIKIIAFCSELYNIISAYSSASLHVQYYPPPLSLNKNRNGKIRAFFWQRVKYIDWEIVKALIGSNEIEKIYFKIDPDPGHHDPRLPSEEDIRKYKIYLIKEWLSKSDYANMLNECNVFISPRAVEGIGVTNLEAMSYGLCVISPDCQTANEYIQNGKNGLLYNLKNPKMLDLSQADLLGENARESIRTGFNKWMFRKNEIFDFIERPYSNDNIKETKIKIMLFLAKVCCTV